jgi:L-ribulose-5-phosphate 3-epimerase
LKTCLYSLTMKNRSIHEVLRYTRDFGYKGIEIWGREPHVSCETTPERAREIRQIAEDYGLTIVAVASYVGRFSTISDQDCEKEFEDLKKYMDVLHELGTDMMRISCGGPNAFLAADYHYEKAAYWLQKCADYAGQAGKRLAMEIHNNTLIESAEDSVKLLNMIDRDNVGIIHDAGNMYISGSDFGFKSVELLSDKIFHVHVKDIERIQHIEGPGSFRNFTKNGDEYFRYTLLNQGGTDHQPLFDALIQAGYQGFLSTECNAPVPDLERAQFEINEMNKMINKGE